VFLKKSSANRTFSCICFIAFCLLITACSSTSKISDKPTIPLEEESISERRSGVMEIFNSCMQNKGYETFRGRPDPNGDPADPQNQSGYIEALQICDTQSGMSSLQNEFAESRTERTPEQIKEQNITILETLECLRSKGWNFEDPLPDENGALNLRSLRNQDNEFDPSQARECMTSLERRIGP